MTPAQQQPTTTPASSRSVPRSPPTPPTAHHSSPPPPAMPSSAAATTTTILAIAMVSLSFALAASAAPAPPPDDAPRGPPTTTVRAGFYHAASVRLRPLAALDASLYTHLYYSALPVHPTTRRLVLPKDPDGAALLAAFSPALKSRNRNLRTLLSVGTTAAGGGGVADVSQADPAFAAMAADPASRAALGAAAVALARDSGFDGLDVAWRFPASAVEMADLGFLVSEWRAAAPPGFLLTATAYFSSHVFAAPLPGVDYPSEALARCLDWVNVAAFGLRPPGTGGGAGANATTAFDAPLYDRASDFSASYGVVSWIDAGVPAGKVVMGIPLYGRSCFLRNKANAGVGAPVVAAGPKQRGSNATGVISYDEVQRLAAAGRRAATTAYDNASVASYLSVGDVWVGFDGAAVVAEKLAFAARRGLLGYFLWPVNYDDANLTVSRTAMEVWMQNEMSSSWKNGTGVRQTQGPVRVRLPPALRSPAGTPGPVPAPLSGSWSCLPRTKLDAFLHLALVILVWCYL